MWFYVMLLHTFVDYVRFNGSENKSKKKNQHKHIVAV